MIPETSERPCSSACSDDTATLGVRLAGRLTRSSEQTYLHARTIAARRLLRGMWRAVQQLTGVSILKTSSCGKGALISTMRPPFMLDLATYPFSYHLARLLEHYAPPPRPARPSFLPAELLDQIFALTDTATLVALAQCSRAFRTLAVRLLYRTVAPTNLYDAQHAAFCAGLSTNPLFATHTRRLDLADVRAWPRETAALDALEELAIGASTELPRGRAMATFPRLRALAGPHGVPASFVRRHPRLAVLNVGGRALRWDALVAFGPGGPLAYLECPVPVALAGLLRDGGADVRWPGADGVLAVVLSERGRPAREAAALLDALDRSGDRAPRTLAVHCGLAAAIAALEPDAPRVTNPRVVRLCLQVSYTKAPMGRFLPAVLSRFPAVRALEIQHDAERPLSMLVPLHDVWARLAPLFAHVVSFVPAQVAPGPSLCAHGLSKCHPNCVVFERRLGFAFGLVRTAGGVSCL